MLFADGVPLWAARGRTGARQASESVVAVSGAWREDGARGTTGLRAAASRCPAACVAAAKGDSEERDIKRQSDVPLLPPHPTQQSKYESESAASKERSE